MLKRIKDRTKSAMTLVAKYNELLPSVPQFPNCPPLTPLDPKNLNTMILTDAFWELEYFQSQEPWAVTPAIRDGISAQQNYHRALEEIQILASEVTRYVNYNITRLDQVQQLLPNVTFGSAIHLHIQHLGVKSAFALQSLKCLDRLSVNPTGFEDIEKSIKGIIDIAKLN